MFRNGRHVTKDRARIIPLFPRPFENNFCTRIDQVLSRVSTCRRILNNVSLPTRSIFYFNRIPFQRYLDDIPTDDSTLTTRYCNELSPCMCVSGIYVRTLLRMETINYSSVVTLPVSRDASRQRSFKCNNRSAPFEPDVNALACEDS